MGGGGGGGGGAETRERRRRGVIVESKFPISFIRPGSSPCLLSKQSLSQPRNMDRY